MQAEQLQISLTPALYRQFSRLKTQGSFTSDSDLLQACFVALERFWERGIPDRGLGNSISEPYMMHPGLSPDDYDT